MKLLFIIFLAILSIATFAAASNIHRPNRRLSTPRKTEIVVPWKTVAAGGAAAGTVIAAYKVSDGIEGGIKTVAKEKPEVFADTLSVLTWPIRWGALILFILVYCEVLRRFVCKITTSTTKGSKKWKSH